MTPYYQDKYVKIYHGDCRSILPQLDKASAIVTDPPYELGFMGKKWDNSGVSFQVETWRILREACKPGAMLLSFGGTRTFHRIAVAIEDAGWEIRDTIMWVYGSGFPKSRDIGKDMEKLNVGGIKNLKVIGTKQGIKTDSGSQGYSYQKEYVPGVCMGGKQISGEIPVYEINNEWQGYGTALKPAYEPILVCMNPLDGTFANNALKHGVAGLNIDGCRIGTTTKTNSHKEKTASENPFTKGLGEIRTEIKDYGRFPANIIHDGSQEVMELFPISKDGIAVGGYKTASSIYGNYMGRKADAPNIGYGGSGSAARFFYCAKASKSERNKGCEELEEKREQISLNKNYLGSDGSLRTQNLPNKNSHPTVKPLALMKYLVKLVKMPEYNLIIDPFCGSGTTLLACIRLDIPCIGIDSDEKSCEIAAKRCSQEVMELF